MIKTRPLAKFGEYLKQARIQVGMNQNEVAAKLGKSQALVAQYEGGGIADPATQVLRDMARLYNKPYLEIILNFIREKYGLNDDEWASLTGAKNG